MPVVIRVPISKSFEEFMKKADEKLAELTPEQIEQLQQHGVRVEIWSE